MQRCRSTNVGRTTTSTALFVNASGLDFHLAAGASEAIDKGVVIGEAGLDIDGRAHDVGAPDLGWDERGAP